MKREEILAVAAFTAAGFLIRLYLLSFHGDIEVDGAFYATLAKKIVARKAFFAPRLPPLFSYLIAAMAPFSGGFEEAGRWISLGMGTAVLPLIYILGRTLGSTRIGIISLSLAAFEPSLCRYSTIVLNEATFLFLFMLALLLSMQLFQNRKGLFSILAGMAWGLAYLTRQEAVVFFFGLILFLIWKGFRRSFQFSKSISLILFACVGFFLIAFPYLHFLKEKTGNWTFSDKGALQLWIGRESVGPGWEERWEKALFGLTKDKTRIVSQEFSYDPQLRREMSLTPREMMRTYLYNGALILKNWLPQLLPPFLLFFLGVGLFVVFSNPDLRRRWLWVAALFPYYFFIPFFYVDSRYFLTLLPFLLVLAAWGVGEMSRKFSRSPRAVWMVAAVVCMSFMPATLSATCKKQNVGELAREVGGWVRENYPEGVRLMDRYPLIAYYGNADLITLPDAPLDDILAYARAHQTQLLVLQKSVVRQVRPWLLLFFDNPGASPALKLIYRKEFPSAEANDEAMVFKFK